jgi:hypothetical protein
MNHNFLGQPSREDLQTLDQLRRQLMPMIGLLDKLHADMQQKMFHGDVVDWPHIRHTISVINSYLTSINAYINGSYRHKEEAIKDTNGKPILDSEKNPLMSYRDTANEGHADQIGAMHVYPQAPFPMTNEQLAGMASILLDKRMGPPEEKWVEERLRKAAEFAYVPGEWGIEARKAVDVKKEENEDEEDDGEQKGALEGLPMKRVKGTLNEDQIMEMWTVGHKTTFDKTYQDEKGIGEVEEEDEEEEDEDEEMEDVKVEGLTPSQGGAANAAPDQDMEDGEEESEAPETPKAPPAPVVMIQRAPPAVHKPVPGVPVMALGIVHRFMASGDVQPPAGQR